MDSIERRAASLIDEAQEKLSPRTFLESSVREMDRGDVETLAVAYLIAQVRNRQRQAVAKVERGAQRTERAPRKGTRQWHEWLDSPEGAEAKEREAALAENEARMLNELLAATGSLVDQFQADLRMEWDAELLRSEFALSDGRKVTWGDATREEHAWRADMHSRNAAAGIEGAARHRAAIRTLDETGTRSLNYAVGIAA